MKRPTVRTTFCATFSVLIHPDKVRAQDQYIISMAVAETMHRFLSGMLDAAIQIKWPNDIYVGDSKIGGILIENHLSGEHIKDCIIGIGLNVNQTVFVSDAPNPISMRMIDDREWNREEVNPISMRMIDDREWNREEVLQGLISELVWQFQHFRFDIIRKKYRRHLYRREGFYPYRDAEGEFEAEMLEVENDGHLVLLDTEGRQRRYAFKEVAYVI